MRTFLLLATGWILAGSVVATADDTGSSKTALRPAGRVLRSANPPDPGRALSAVSRPQEAGVGPAARLAGGRAQGERRRAGRGAGPARGEPARSRRSGYDAAGQDAAQGEAARPGDRRPDRLGQAWAPLAGEPAPARARRPSTCRPTGPLGVPARQGSDPRQGQGCRLARDPVDRFILARLEAEGSTPSPPADRRTLIRRATFDLTGLPPTPEEVDAFEADTAPDAYDRLVDRLLASPRYGERWGRYWLDVARYADTKGYVFFQDADFHWAYHLPRLRHRRLQPRPAL